MVEDENRTADGQDALPLIQVLHLEDSPADSGLVAAVLESYGDARFIYENVPTLKAAKARLRDKAGERVDVVLLDLGLPDAQGLESLRGILEVAPDTPAVVLTGNQDAKFGRESVAIGAEDYLEKDLATQGNLLGRTLEYAIERSRRRREAPPHTADEPEAESGVTIPTIGKEALHFREPGEFNTLQKRYLNLLRHNSEPARRQALGVAASDIINQLTQLQADPLDLVYLHSRAMRLLQKNGADRNGDTIRNGRQLFLTMMSRLSSYYLGK